MKWMMVLGILLCAQAGLLGPSDWHSRMAVLFGIVGGVLVGASPL